LLKPEDFFDLEEYEFRGVFDGCEFVWQALKRIGAFVLDYITDLDSETTIFGEVRSGAHIDDRNSVVIGDGTVVEPGAYIQGPAIIGNDCQIRHGAYIRGDVIIGNNCVVGHSTEMKNSILLDNAAAPHFAYVGDSILGRDVNLGAGTKLSNLPVVSVQNGQSAKRPTIKITVDGTVYDTGLSKLGAILGDGSQTGCNVVTNPGTIIGRRTLVYPNMSVKKGYYGPDNIIKLRQDTEMVARTQ
jgi:UDP-N-acetylglucosamine diphosphorylase / glucose-1-phosphate thymidylyltransferase / UDP-N-acetylgalactosamine diphosphorylase / glucosamine-1-phosphate N-acetyltransferase / galactosamine-1-phosphate N-acetyltransferase